MGSTILSGERSPTVVAATFADGGRADRAATELRGLGPAWHARIFLIGPDDPTMARKLEPEQTGIWKTLRRSHLTLGATGLVAGLALCAGLAAAGVQAVLSSIWMALAACALLGMFAGLLIAGVISIRPDHDVVINDVREALDKGRWAVVAHPTDSDEIEAAVGALERAGGDVVRSL